MKELGHFKWLDGLSQTGVVQLWVTGNVSFHNDPCFFSKNVFGDSKIYPDPTDVFEFDTSHLEYYCYILNTKHMTKVSDETKDMYWSEMILKDLEGGHLSENLLERLMK